MENGFNLNKNPSDLCAWGSWTSGRSLRPQCRWASWAPRLVTVRIQPPGGRWAAWCCSAPARWRPRAAHDTASPWRSQGHREHLNIQWLKYTFSIIRTFLISELICNFYIFWHKVKMSGWHNCTFIIVNIFFKELNS